MFLAAHEVWTLIKDSLLTLVVYVHDQYLLKAVLTKFQEKKTRSAHLTATKPMQAFL